MNERDSQPLATPTAAPGYLAYWGKARPEGDGPTFHHLAYHSLDVAAVGFVLLERDPGLRRRLSETAGLTPASAEAFAVFTLALHDLGKFASAFQDLKPDLVAELQGPRPRRAYARRHDAMGLALWCDAVADRVVAQRAIRIRNPPEWLGPKDLTYLLEPWMRAVLGHHGQPVNDRGSASEDFSPKERARSDVLGFVDEISRLLGPVELQFEQPLLDAGLEQAFGPTSWLVAGFAVLCDWVGSNTQWFPYREDVVPLASYWGEAQVRAERALEAAGVLPCRARPAGPIGELYPAIIAPRPMQRAVADVQLASGPQLFILEDLTGSGKTEAAVSLAHRLIGAGEGGGIFFALPTMATANAMYERIQAVVPRLFAENEAPSVVLAHSAPQLAKLRDLALPDHACEGDYTRDEPSVSAQCSAWIADSRKRALLAHIGVGTLDQALMSVMEVRHGTLRLLGVNRNILVVDEVHAYDAYMTAHLSRLLEFQAGLGGSAILLSATIPTEDRQQLIAAFQRGLGRSDRRSLASAYPLLTQVSGSGITEREVSLDESARRNIGVRTLGTVDEVVDWAVRQARAGKRVCWIRNTVQDALDAHALLGDALAPDELMLFHARFAMGDRLRTEASVLREFGKGERPASSRGKVLVATQVVEQSLDLDFDELVTDLAPMDLVIQRAGRLHRHARAGRGEPVLHLLAPAFEEEPDARWYARMFSRAAYVYPHTGQLWLTLRELLTRGALTLPTEARALMDAVFSEEARNSVPAGLERASLEAETGDKQKASIAQGTGVDLRSGYGGADRPWDTDARVATRLGDPTSLVRLVRCSDAGLKPWIEHPTLAWELSQLQVARRKLDRIAPEDQPLVEEIEATMPFAGEGTLTLLLTARGNEWEGRGLDHKGRAVRAVYDPEIGLRIERKA